ncbi:MAG: hypothetical protein Q8922_04680 [Bacteroidota bacterium]|nr:hypothetical protein [Bacteroidota bacterium]MDP4231877.1 hypothetical protein [Bacteroidota bacterium]MDP4242763.1 hypothetical protein [Bacteroidota bacterium]MDP4287214.1 hypothetical protein [Bacteroidota bacterium]
MTRELLFTTSFEPQFAAHMGWTAVGLEGARPLALSDLPGFELVLGETTFTAYDSFGYAIAGSQALGLNILWSHPQLELDARLATRSDYIGLTESFFGGLYTPPTPSPSDPDRIDSITIVKIDPPTLRKNDTRSVLSVRGQYSFTIL